MNDGAIFHVPVPPENDSAIEEICLLAQIGAGDREAFRQLYARYTVPMFSLAVRMIGDPGEAEELMQDAWVKIWRNARAYDSRKSRPFTWAVTIMRRTCIDHLRRCGRRNQKPPSLVLTGNEPASDAAPSEVVATHEDMHRVVAALASMSVERRGALELALFTEFTHVEIARHLNQPVGTVKSWIRRGLLDLRTCLNDLAR